MENTSKALLIAAAVLVVIIIIAFGLRIFNSSSDTGQIAQNMGKTINEKTGQATKFAISAIAAKTQNNINYGEKTNETIAVGDDITIGSEKFKVVIKTSNKITAIPYYNIELKTSNPKQSNEAGKIAFSTTKYWENGKEVDIDMTSDKNNIQKYIDAYGETLRNLGAQNIVVRIARYSDIILVEKKMRNPGKLNTSYWLGTSNPYSKSGSNSSKVHMVYSDGNTDGYYNGYFYTESLRG